MALLIAKCHKTLQLLLCHQSLKPKQLIFIKLFSEHDELLQDFWPKYGLIGFDNLFIKILNAVNSLLLKVPSFCPDFEEHGS